MFLISLIMTIYSNFTLLKKNKNKGDIKMDAEYVIQTILSLYKSRLFEGRDFSYSTVYINGVQINFDDFSICDDILFFDFNDNQNVSIHLNDIYEIS